MQNKDSGGVPEDFLPSLLRALDELGGPDADPDRPISQETKDALGKFLEIAEEENRKFLSGSFAMDATVLVKLHKAASLFKRLEEKGYLHVKKIYADPGISPAYVEAESDGFILTTEDRTDFADAVESCGNYEFEPDLYGKVHITLTFPALWVEVRNEGAEGENES